MALKQKKILIFLVLLFSVLLTGCASSHDLWVYDDGSWKFEMEMEYNFDVIPSISGSIEGFGIGLDLGAITEELYQFIFEQRAAYDRSRGLDADFDVHKKGGSTVFTYEMSGDTISQLRKAVSLDESLKQLGPDVYEELSQVSTAYTIQENPDGSVYLEIIVPTMSLGETFTLHGRQIEDFGTATQVKGNKAIWENPTQIRAHFIPLSRGGAIASVAAWITGGLTLLGGLVFLAVRLLGSGFGVGRRPAGRIPKPSTLASRHYAPQKSSPYGAKSKKRVNPVRASTYGSRGGYSPSRSRSQGVPAWAWGPIVAGVIVILGIVLILLV